MKGVRRGCPLINMHHYTMNSYILGTYLKDTFTGFGTMDEAMSLEAVLVSITFLFFIKILFSNVIKNSKKKLPPSPPALPILGHLHLLKPPLHQALIGISKCYGPITFLRFGSHPVVVISSAKLAEECFTANDLAFANRVHLPTVMLPNVILMANYGSYWRNVRQIVAVELLSNQKLQATSDIRACEIRDTARHLFQSYNQTKKSEGSSGFEKLQVKTILFNLLLNVTMMMIAGTQLCGDSIENMEEMKRYKEAIEVWFELSGGHIIEDFFPILRMLDLRGFMKRMRDATDVSEMMVQKLINEHRRGGAEKKKTMIARMLELQKEDPEKYSDLVIQNICITLLLGGTETSATTIQWAMANLLNNPEILKRATLEIDEHVGHERLIEESDMANLPYLHHIINETLQIFPAGPLLAPHESSKEVIVGGYKIPPGTMLLVNIYHIQRSPEIWNEPTKFKPERFERGNSDAKWMIPFGMSRRKCPGEALAMREMGLILGTLIQCFDWDRVDGTPVDMTEGTGLTLPMAVPLEALYQPRQAMIKVLSEL